MWFRLPKLRSTENPEEGTQHEFILLPKGLGGKSRKKGRGILACPLLRWWSSFSSASEVCQGGGDLRPTFLARASGKHEGQQPLRHLWSDLQLGSVHLVLTWVNLRFSLHSFPWWAFGAQKGFYFKLKLFLHSKAIYPGNCCHEDRNEGFTHSASKSVLRSPWQSTSTASQSKDLMKH